MDIGERIAKLRKENKMSQETLSEKLGVVRQTISKWETGQSSPDISQAKKMAKIFSVSLDELTGENSSIKEDINNKKSNKTRKLITFLCIGLLVIFGIYFIYNLSDSGSDEIVAAYEFECFLDGQEYIYEIKFDKHHKIHEAGGSLWISDHIDVDQYDDANKIKNKIKQYFKENGGKCEVKKVKDGFLF